MVNNATFFKYVKIALFGWGIMLCGFASAHFTVLDFIGKAIMWIGILLGWWGVGKATQIFFRARFK